MAKADRNRIHSISILIQWWETDSGQADDSHYSLQSTVTIQSQQQPKTDRRDVAGSNLIQGTAPRATSHLLPTDRLVLRAIRDKVPQGETVTPPIRLRELMKVCSISRRQVQICLRRLGEKGVIERLTEGVALGNQEGYQYRVLQQD